MATVVNKLRVEWKGKAASVNEWTKARVLRQGASVRATIYKTQKYKQFVDHMVLSFQTEGQCMRAGYVDMTLIVSLWKQRDTDNVLKPVMDALQQSGIIEDDKFIRNINIVRDYHKRDTPDNIRVYLDLVAPEELNPMVTG